MIETTNAVQNDPSSQEDCIAAIATGVGGGIAVLRLSGSKVLSVINPIWVAGESLSKLSARRLVLGKIVDPKGDFADQCLGVYMPSPHSYTGEDVVEIHCHGGSLVAKNILSLLLQYGARHAEPGEFTKRAFLHGKLDLTQAEAVLDIIQSRSNMVLRLATKQLQGMLGKNINSFYQTTKRILAEIEVRMDFVDEDLDWDSVECLVSSINALSHSVKELLDRQRDADIIRNGIRLTILGIPNAGKSSLLNAILGRNRAIVSDVPGTTRDTVEELTQIRNIPICITDTAGIHDTDHPVEKQGISRSLDSGSTAHLILWVVDGTKSIDEQKNVVPWKNKPVLGVVNKIDIIDNLKIPKEFPYPWIAVSAHTGEGLPKLYQEIERCIWHHADIGEEPEIAINTRHGALLEKALSSLDKSIEHISNEAFELAASDLKVSLVSLGKIVGKTVEPDILETIFHHFCIGK